jgi:hypothetical protein
LVLLLLIVLLGDSQVAIIHSATIFLLAKMLESTESQVAHATLGTLAQHGVSYFNSILVPLIIIVDNIRAAILQSTAIPSLVNMLKSDGWQVIPTACETLKTLARYGMSFAQF